MGIYNEKNTIWERVTVFGRKDFLVFFALFFFAQLKFYEFFIFFYLFMISYIFVIPLRIAFFKHRPKPKKYKNILEKIDSGAFPSTHTLRAFAYIIVFSNIYPNILVILMFSILAVLVGISRIQLHRHFYTDVLVGAILGLFVGLISLTLSNMMFF